MKPGDTHIYRGLIWLVERIELRGDNEHWAKLVINKGVGKTSRLINVEWIRTDKGGEE